MTTKYSVGHIVAIPFRVDNIMVSDKGIFYNLTAIPKFFDENYNLVAKRIPEEHILPMSKIQSHP